MNKENSYHSKNGTQFYFSILFFYIAILNYQHVLTAQVNESLIHENWKICSLEANPNITAEDLNEIIKSDLNGEWINVRNMPAMVPDILLDNERIVEPWMPGKANEYTWISKKDWVYKTEFTTNKPNLNSILKFKGLDCIVDIYLNREIIASYSNMYIPLEIDVTGKLKTKNELIVYFHSPFQNVDDQYTPIRRINGERVRRPNQSYINYLGPDPYFSRVGVFDDIVLSQYSDIHIDKAVVSSSLNKELTIGEIDLRLKGTAVNDNNFCVVSLMNLNGEIILSRNFHISQSEGIISSEHKIEVKNPILWWPRGYGDPYLYTVKVDIKTDNVVRQSIKKRIGFRRVEMKKLFHFVVNNRPVKLWGGNWVSPDWTTVVWSETRAEKLFALAENANFNAFRVWGVVESPDDHFYELADERGFMLWQDFTNLPLSADQESIDICKNESIYLIERLIHHPSVFVWCGGNENALWHHKEYNAPLEDRGDWSGTAATDEIEKIVKKLDPDRYFFPTSPYLGIDPNDPKEGNTHGYTNLWFVPGYDYLNFASEDTRISCPTLKSMKRFMFEKDIWPDDYSPIFKHGDIYPFPETWMNYSTSFSWRKMGPIEQYYDAHDAASLVYRIGMAEAQYYRETIERQRRGRTANDSSDERFCGGYLVWKFNDSWPQIYSAKVDYFLEPYHAYYALKKAYKPVMLSFDMDSYITLWVVNDSKEKIKGTVTFKLFHLDKNEVRAEISKNIEVGTDQSKVVIDLYREGIGSFRLEHILFAELRDENNNVIAATHQLADIERDIVFPNATLDINVINGDLIITTDKYAKSVHLSGDHEGNEFGWLFGDNYFDVIPGEKKKVKILGEHNSGIITAKPWYSSESTVINWSGD